MRFLLLGLYDHDEPELVNEVSQLRDACPALFEGFIPASFRIDENVLLDDDDDESLVYSDGQGRYQSVMVHTRIAQKYCRTYGLLTRSGQITEAWRQLL